MTSPSFSQAAGYLPSPSPAHTGLAAGATPSDTRPASGAQGRPGAPAVKSAKTQTFPESCAPASFPPLPEKPPALTGVGGVLPDEAPCQKSHRQRCEKEANG